MQQLIAFWLLEHLDARISDTQPKVAKEKLIICPLQTHTHTHSLTVPGAGDT